MKRDSRLSLALHALLHIAEFQEAVTSESLGEQMGINPVVIRRTMAGLREAGLVESVKGPGGGWSVAKPLKDISLLDIYQSLDEPVLIQQHREIESPGCLVEQAVGRALNHTFEEAEALIRKRFEKMKLSEIFDEFHAHFQKHKAHTKHGAHR